MFRLGFVAIATIVSLADAGFPASRLPRPPPSTRVVQLHELMTAAPTALHELLKRQASSSSVTYTVTIAPDETCGFLSGSAGSPITCPGKGTCMWEANALDVIFCGAEFDSHLLCFEREAALDPQRCNDVCESNIFNLRCTDTAAPFCRTYQFPSGIRDYRCASTSPTAIQTIDFTYVGQTDRQFSTLVLDDTTTSRPPLRPSTTSAAPGPVSTTGTPNPSPVPKPKKGSNTGAIVGGTIGGVAAVGLIVLAVVLFIRHRNKAAARPTSYQPGVSPANQYMFDGKGPSSPDPSSQYGPTSPVSFLSSQPNRTSELYPMPVGQGMPYPNQPAPVPLQHGAVPEAGPYPTDHHRGQMHELS